MFEVFTQIYVNLSKKLKFMKIFRKNLWFFTSHQLFSHNQIFYEFFPIQNKNSQSAPKSLSSSIKSITISNHFRIAKQRLRKFSITLTSSLNHFSFFLITSIIIIARSIFSYFLFFCSGERNWGFMFGILFEI